LSCDWICSAPGSIASPCGSAIDQAGEAVRLPRSKAVKRLHSRYRSAFEHLRPRGPRRHSCLLTRAPGPKILTRVAEDIGIGLGRRIGAHITPVYSHRRAAKRQRAASVARPVDASQAHIAAALCHARHQSSSSWGNQYTSAQRASSLCHSEPRGRVRAVIAMHGCRNLACKEVQRMVIIQRRGLAYMDHTRTFKPTASLTVRRNQLGRSLLGRRCHRWTPANPFLLTNRCYADSYRSAKPVSAHRYLAQGGLYCAWKVGNRPTRLSF